MNDKKTILIYSFGHFVIDLASAYIILSVTDSIAKASVYYLLYNFLAFALQLPVGLIADKLGGFSGFAVIGILSAVIGALTIRAPIVSVAACGIGNCFYHVGGGAAVLYRYEGFSKAGIFVSVGAIGLFIGRIMRTRVSVYVIIGILLFCALIIVIADRRYDRVNLSLKIKKRATAAVICIFTVTVLRSYASMSLFPAMPTFILSVISVVGIALGKALGGIFADIVSVKTVSVLSLLLSAICFILPNSAIFGVLSMLFFNMSMPLTLTILTRVYRGAKAFAFGVLTLALFIGFLPTCFNLAIYIPFTVVCLISLLLLIGGIHYAK